MSLPAPEHEHLARAEDESALGVPSLVLQDEDVHRAARAGALLHVGHARDHRHPVARHQRAEVLERLLPVEQRARAEIERVPEALKETVKQYFLSLSGAMQK